jgi:AraC-like DNA-binding protein
MNLKVSIRHSSALNYPVGQWDWYSLQRPYYNLWISLLGQGVLEINRTAYDVSPGFACLLHPEDAVIGMKPADTAFCNIGLHFDLIPAEALSTLLARLHMQPTHLRNLNVIRELTRYMVDLMQEEGADSQSECDLLGAQVLKIFIRDWDLGPEDPIDRLIRVQAEALRNYPEREWSLALLAEEAGLSVSQFSRRFSALYHISANAFMIQQRVEKAKGLLEESTLSVGEISEILGYADVAFFSRQFKSRFGISPSMLRKKPLLV